MAASGAPAARRSRLKAAPRGLAWEGQKPSDTRLPGLVRSFRTAMLRLELSGLQAVATMPGPSL